MQTDTLQDVNLGGEIAKYIKFYTQTTGWRSPITSWRMPIYVLGEFRSLGTTPISGKTLSEWKGHSRSSRRVPGYSRSSSRNSKFHSRNTKFHSRNGIPRLEQYETHNSRSNSRSDSRNLWEPTWNIFICPCILGAFFQELGRSPCARRVNIYTLEAEIVLGVLPSLRRSGTPQSWAFLNLWFACGSPFKKTTEITKTPKTTQTKANKELSVGSPGNDRTTEMTKTTGIEVPKQPWEP